MSDKPQFNSDSLLKERAKIIMEIQFVGFISDLTNSTLQYLGRLKNPKTNQFAKNIQQAEKMIYILDMLYDKTKNNLTPMEKEHLRNSIDRTKRIFLEETQSPGDVAEIAPKLSISIRHILVDSESTASDLLKQLTDGANFSEIAKMNSQCNSRAEGGFIEDIKPGDLPKSVEDIAFNLRKDEMSGVIQSIMGYHIVKLVELKST